MHCLQDDQKNCPNENYLWNLKQTKKGSIRQVVYPGAGVGGGLNSIVTFKILTFKILYNTVFY